MSLSTILFLFAVYVGPLLGAAVGATTVGGRPAGLNVAVGGGVAVTLCVAFMGMFNAYIFYAGPVVGTIASFFIARWLSK